MLIGRVDDPEGQRTGRDNGASSSNLPTAKARSDGWNLLMFIMLLCSVGLNLYLWALSRGFYMRYQELADELRETFTVAA